MNKSILMGRLTKDPDLRYTSGNNTAVCSFTIAVNRRMPKEGQPQADFINCIAWSKTAEFVTKYFKKGQQMAVVGRIQTRTWEDNESRKHYVTEIVVEEVDFAGSRPKNEANKSDADDSETNQDEGFYPSETDDELPF